MYPHWQKVSRNAAPRQASLIAALVADTGRAGEMREVAAPATLAAGSAQHRGQGMQVSDTGRDGRFREAAAPATLAARYWDRALQVANKQLSGLKAWVVIFRFLFLISFAPIRFLSPIPFVRIRISFVSIRDPKAWLMIGVSRIGNFLPAA